MAQKTHHFLSVSQKVSLQINILKEFYRRFELVKDETGSAILLSAQLLQLLLEQLVLYGKLLHLVLYGKLLALLGQDLLPVHLDVGLLNQGRLAIAGFCNLERLNLSVTFQNGPQLVLEWCLNSLVTFKTVKRFWQ